MDAQEFSSALQKLSLKNGDIVFYDETAIDTESIVSINSPSPDQDDVLFIPVCVPHGTTVRDAVFRMSAEELETRVNCIRGQVQD